MYSWDICTSRTSAMNATFSPGMLITLSSAAESFHSSTLNTGRELRIETSSRCAAPGAQRLDDGLDEGRGLLAGVALDHLGLQIAGLPFDLVAQ